MSLSQPAEFEGNFFSPASSIELTYQPLSQRRRRHWRSLGYVLVFLACLALAADAVVIGVRLRKEIYLNGVHYYGDIYNAFRYGSLAVKYPPLLDYPETITHGVPEYSQGKFDYPPLRLTVSYLWAKWMDKNFPGTRDWPDGPNFHMAEPLLNLNTATELVSAVFVFMLIRMWKIRADDAQRPINVAPKPFRGVAEGMIGALLFWFNPAILINAHDWPQWDVWFFPFVLGAMLLASVDAWLGVGIVLAIGACFKGQVLLALPFFVLWPLFRIKLDAILQLAGGFVLAFGAVALPFMRPTDPAVHWIWLAGAAPLLLIPFAFRWRIHFGWMIGLAVIGLLMAYPWQSSASGAIKFLPIAIFLTAGFSRLVRRSLSISLYALTLGLLAFLVIPLFHGKTYWYDVSFDYGARKFMTMAVVGTHNLPSILCSYFGWGGGGEGSPLATHWVPFLGDVVIRKFLHGVQTVCVMLCAIGAAIHSRRPDTRILLSLTTTMLCAFVVLPQLNDRYVVWAAGLSALLAGVNMGLALIGVIISCVGWIGMAELMYSKYEPSREWTPYLARMQTNLGWILVFAAVIYLYMIFAPRKRPAVVA